MVPRNSTVDRCCTTSRNGRLEAAVDDLGDLSVDDLSVGDLYVDDIPVDDLSVDYLSVDHP